MGHTKEKPFDPQAALDRYRFQDKGVDLYPNDASDLTPRQLASLEYNVSKVLYLKGLKETESRLRGQRDRLRALAGS
jgi:hypothetical protein